MGDNDVMLASVVVIIFSNNEMLAAPE